MMARRSNVSWMEADRLYVYSDRGETSYFYAQSQLKNGGWKGILVRDYGRYESRGPLKHTVNRSTMEIYRPMDLADVPDGMLRRFDKADIAPAAANPPACEMNAAAHVVGKCARWLGDDANEARGLAAAWQKGVLSDKQAKRLQKIFDRLAKSTEPVVQRCIEEELLQAAVGNPRSSTRSNPRTKASDRIQLSNGDVMTLAEAIDAGRVELRALPSSKTGKPSYTAWEAPDFNVGWEVGKTFYESCKGLPISAKRQRNAQAVGNPAETSSGAIRLLPGEIFVKSSSHRSTAQIKRTLGHAPQSYYSFDRDRSAGTSFFVMDQRDFDRVKDIRGVSKAKIQSGESWQPTIKFMNPVASTSDQRVRALARKLAHGG